MRKLLAATSLLCLIATTPSLAQTATGTGVGISGSNSQSGAAAQSNNAGIGNSTATGTGISGAEANSASGSVAAGNVVNLAAAPANQTINSNSTVSGTTTSNVNSRISGSTTVKTNPSLAVGLAAAGLETCLGSASGGLSLAGFGAVGGSTYTDEGCQARLDARTLMAFGLKAAAVARLCARADIWRSMPDVCQHYWPVGVPAPSGIVIVAPAPRITMSADGGGGSIRVVDGRDGVEKDCLNYSSTKQKCYRWAGEPISRSMVRTAAVNPTVQAPRAVAKPKPKPAPTAAMPAQAKPPVETPKVEPKPEEKKS